MSIADFFAALLRMFGLKKSENGRRLEKLIQKAREQIRKESNRLEDHKFDIRNMESERENLEAQWRAETSQNIKRILGGQLDALLHRFDTYRDILSVIERNKKCWELIEGKAIALKSAYESDVVGTDIIDDLIGEMADIREEQRTLARDEERLRAQRFEETPQSDVSDLERRLAESRVGAGQRAAPVQPAPVQVQTPVVSRPVERELLEE